MRSKITFATLMIAAVVLLSSGNARALKLHNFDCGLCHTPGAVWTSVDGGTQGNICLQCHGSAPSPTPLNTEYGCYWEPAINNVVCGETADPDGASATPGAGFSVGGGSRRVCMLGPGHHRAVS